MEQLSYEIAKELKDAGYPQKDWNFLVKYDKEKYGSGIADYLNDPNHA